MFIPVLFFIIGLLCLIKGGDWFVDGSTGIARRFRLPELLIGATVVSIGTTLPEVMVSTTSALTGHSEIAYGNAIGSVICNTALIAAVTIAVRPGPIDKRTLRTPVLFFFTAALLYAGVAYLTGSFSRPVGFLLLGIFLVYMASTILQMKHTPAEGDRKEGVKIVERGAEGLMHAMEKSSGAKSELMLVQEDGDGASKERMHAQENGGGAAKEAMRVQEYGSHAVRGSAHVQEGAGKEKESKEEEGAEEGSIAKDLLMLLVGAVLIAVGADLLVDNGTLIAQALGVPESVIALTFVALGTSLPELVTAITSLAKGHGALSLGNVIGANLFNLVLVSGVSVTLAPFRIPQNAVLFGHNASLVLDIPVMFTVMLLMTLPALIKGKLYRAQGLLLLLLYGAFCAVQFML